MAKIFKVIAIAMRFCTLQIGYFLVDLRECLDLTGLFVANIFIIHECFLNTFLTKTSEISDLQHSEKKVKPSAFTPQRTSALNLQNFEPSNKSFENMKQSCHAKSKKPSDHSVNMKPSGHSQKMKKSVPTENMKISGHSENIKSSSHSEKMKPSGHYEKMKTKPLGHYDNIKPLVHSQKMKIAALFENINTSGHSDIMKPLGHKMKISDFYEHIKPSGHFESMEISGNSENTNKPGHSENMKIPGHSENTKKPGHSENMKKPGHSANMEISGHSENIKKPSHSENTKKPGHSENTKKPGHSENTKKPGHSENMKIPVHSEILKQPGQSEFLKPLGHQNESSIYSFPGQAKPPLVPQHQLLRSLSQDSLTGHFVSGNYLTRSTNGQKKRCDKWEPLHKKLDLHKKTVSEAVESFYRFTNRQLQYYKENGYRDEDKYIFVITGHCKNRPDRVARIKPEIERILHEEQLSHFWFNNGGEVMIEFDCSELAGYNNDQLSGSESMACNCEDEFGYLSC